MHEMGIVLHLAKTLDETAAEEHLARIGSVTLQVGEVSGILTDYFQECWDYFKVRHPVLKDTELILETIPAVTWCDNCKRTYETVKYGRECPYCHSGETWLLRGNECIIKEIEAEEAPDEAESG
ncbi:MAG: hydrogenase maturation nickel metallochaperone HypA [Oscillospiraceae bacterium]|nr:hydrogenase maturation nickel metallochaperone HypA [Oscillospiraceae bacterium]